MKSKKIIEQEIEAFVQEQGGSYTEFYIGITNNIERRIVEDTTLNEHLKNGRYIKDAPYYLGECESREIANEIEEYYQLKKGMKDYNPGAVGKIDSRFIYCFKQNPDFELRKKVRKILHEELKKFPTYDEFIKSLEE